MTIYYLLPLMKMKKETKTIYILRLRKSKLELFVVHNEESGYGKYDSQSVY